MAKKVRAKVDWKSIGRKIASSHKLNKELENVCKRKFRKSKAKLMNNFNNHPVTQEIMGGSSSQNVSGALDGYGNLFSFIGFPEGSMPTDEIKMLLENSVKLKISKGKSSTRGVKKILSVKIPSMRDFAAIGKMPYEAGNSWIEKIEKGISNFSNYMHKKTNASRSGSGIQIKGKIRTTGSKPTRYMTELLAKFKEELRSK
jgi:hypothetical protein